jgi:hypothetical protein
MIQNFSSRTHPCNEKRHDCKEKGEQHLGSDQSTQLLLPKADGESLHARRGREKAVVTMQAGGPNTARARMRSNGTDEGQRQVVVLPWMMIEAVERESGAGVGGHEDGLQRPGVPAPPLLPDHVRLVAGGGDDPRAAA